MNCHLSFDSSQKCPKRNANDLAGFEASQLSQFVQNRLVFAAQVNGRRTGTFVVRRSQHLVDTPSVVHATLLPVAQRHQSAISGSSLLGKKFDNSLIPNEKRVKFADFIRRLLREGFCVYVSIYGQWVSILDYLAWAESAEADVWLRDDIRIAWITVSFAAQGYEQPHIAATYQVLGLHPSKVYAAISERRKAILGPEFVAHESALDSLPPKKPVSSSQDEQERAA